MDLKRYLNILLIAFASTAIVACGDDDETDDTEYPPMNGTAIVEGIPSFVRAGETYTAECNGIRTLNGEAISYQWVYEPMILVSSDSNKITLTVPSDTLTTVTLKCTGTASGFSSSIVYKYVTIVHPYLSLTNRSTKLTGTFLDERDNRTYIYNTIGGLDWFCSNLDYQELGIPYDNEKAMLGIFGQYYNWEEAIEACPEGWRIPTEEDWKSLAESITGETYKDELCNYFGVGEHIMSKARFNGNDMWELWPQLGIDNSLNLEIIPTGYSIYDLNGEWNFGGVNKYAFFWTSTESSESEGVARYLTITKNSEGDPVTALFPKIADKKAFYFPVRPVRDHVE